MELNRATKVVQASRLQPGQRIAGNRTILKTMDLSDSILIVSETPGGNIETVAVSATMSIIVKD